MIFTGLWILIEAIVVVDELNDPSDLLSFFSNDGDPPCDEVTAILMCICSAAAASST